MDSRRYARLQVEKIQQRIKVLKSHPRLGKTVKETGDPQIKEIIEGNYRIVYRVVSENRIDILLIHHGARDLKRRLIK